MGKVSIDRFPVFCYLNRPCCFMSSSVALFGVLDERKNEAHSLPPGQSVRRAVGPSIAPVDGSCHKKYEIFFRSVGSAVPK